MDFDTASIVRDQSSCMDNKNIIMPEISGVENKIQLEMTPQHLVDPQININEIMDYVVWFNYYYYFFFNKVPNCYYFDIFNE